MLFLAQTHALAHAILIEIVIKTAREGWEQAGHGRSTACANQGTDETETKTKRVSNDNQMT